MIYFDCVACWLLSLFCVAKAASQSWYVTEPFQVAYRQAISEPLEESKFWAFIESFQLSDVGAIEEAKYQAN